MMSPRGRRGTVVKARHAPRTNRHHPPTRNLLPWILPRGRPRHRSSLIHLSLSREGRADQVSVAAAVAAANPPETAPSRSKGNSSAEAGGDTAAVATTITTITMGAVEGTITIVMETISNTTRTRREDQPVAMPPPEPIARRLPLLPLLLSTTPTRGGGSRLSPPERLVPLPSLSLTCRSSGQRQSWLGKGDYQPLAGVAVTGGTTDWRRRCRWVIWKG